MLLPAVLSACAAQASPAPRGPDDTPPPASAQPAPQSATPSMADAVAPTVTTREMTDGILTDFYLPDRTAMGYRPGVMALEVATRD